MYIQYHFFCSDIFVCIFSISPSINFFPHTPPYPKNISCKYRHQPKIIITRFCKKYFFSYKKPCIETKASFFLRNRESKIISFSFDRQSKTVKVVEQYEYESYHWYRRWRKNER